MLAFGQLLKNSTLQSRLSLFLIVAAEISVRFIEDQLSVRPHCCKERLIVLVQILKPNFRLRITLRIPGPKTDISNIYVIS